MRNLFKKSLAFCLVAALALTCFIGSFSVSAATTYNATITASASELTFSEDAQQATITLTITSEKVGISEALLKVSTAAGTISNAVVTSATVKTETGNTVDTTSEASKLSQVLTIDNGTASDFGSFTLSANQVNEGDATVLTSFSNAVITLTLQVPASLAVNSYPINIETDGVKAASNSEDVINFSYSSADVLVKDMAQEHQHEADGNNEIVKFESGVINNYYTCSKCEELVLSSTDSSANAAKHSETVNNFELYSAIDLNVAGGAEIKIAPESTEDDLKLAYVDEDKIIANGLHSKTIEFNPIVLVSYVDGVEEDVITIDSTVDGIIIAYNLVDSIETTALDTALTSTGMTQTLSLQSGICYSFKLNKSADNGNFDSYYAIAAHDNFSTGVETRNYSEPIAPDSEIDNSYHFFEYSVAAKEMGDNISCYYYGVKDGVDYLIRVKTDYSAVVYAETNGFVIDDADLKVLVANMLRYGSYAQEFFGYNIGDLIANRTSVKDNISTYASETIDKDTVPFIESKSDTPMKIPDTTTNIVGWQKSLACEDRIEVVFKLNLANFNNYYCQNNDYSAQDDLSIKITYFDINTKANKTVDLTLADKDRVEGTYYVFQFGEIYPNYMDKEVTCAVYYKGELASTTYYSINTYLVKEYNSTVRDANSTTTINLGMVCQSIVAYGNSVKSYFA